jgi:hypothetical protein
MSITYTLRAADGQEYGPVTLEDLQSWATQNRLNADSDLKRSDMDYWAKAGDFTELKGCFPAAPAASAPTTVSAAAMASARPQAYPAVGGFTGATPVEDASMVAQLKSGASWFYWIAGLSLINSLVALTGNDWHFILGLGITRVLDAIGAEFGGGGKIVTFILDLLVAGLLILFGVFGYKRHLWAFIVGIVLFALDSLFFVVASEWLGVAFHAFVLFCLFRGMQACRALRQSA